MTYSIVGIILFVLFIIALVDILKSGMDTGKKLIWVLVVLLLPLIGTLLWFLIGRK